MCVHFFCKKVTNASPLTKKMHKNKSTSSSQKIYIFTISYSQQTNSQKASILKLPKNKTYQNISKGPVTKFIAIQHRPRYLRFHIPTLPNSDSQQPQSIYLDFEKSTFAHNHEACPLFIRRHYSFSWSI